MTMSGLVASAFAVAAYRSITRAPLRKYMSILTGLPLTSGMRSRTSAGMNE